MSRYLRAPEIIHHQRLNRTIDSFLAAKEGQKYEDEHD